MSIHKVKDFGTNGANFTFPIAVNDAFGNQSNAVPITILVRDDAALFTAAPVYSVSVDRLTNAAYGSGAYQAEVSASTALGFSAQGEYSVFVLASVSGATPIGVVGTFEFRDIITSAELSANMQNVLTNYNVASADETVTSAGVSAIVRQNLEDQLLHTLVANSVSVSAIAANSLIAIMLSSADPLTYNRATDSLQAISEGGGGGLTSAQVSVIVLQAVGDHFAQPAIGELGAVPTWNDMSRDDCLRWTTMRVFNQIIQSSTSTGMYLSAGTQMGSAVVALTSTSARTDQWFT